MIRYDATRAAFYREKLIERVQADTRTCYQCGNCTAGCPAAFTFDYTPNQVMRMLQVGLVEKLLDSTAVQLCIQCLTCTARCPRNIDIAGIFEDLKTVAAAQQREVPEEAKTFAKAFMSAVARYGQLPELYMMAMFYLGTMKPKMALADVGLAMPMITKGKMQVLPRKVKGADEVARIYKKTMVKARARAKAEAEAVLRATSTATATTTAVAHGSSTGAATGAATTEADE